MRTYIESKDKLRSCIVCGIKLKRTSAKNQKRKFCSRLCTRRHQNKSLFTGRHIEKCGFCGNQFEAIMIGNKFCSKICRKREYYHKMGYKSDYRKMPHKCICLVCKKKFLKNSTSQKFCSLSCYKANKREMDALKYNYGTTKVLFDVRKMFAYFQIGKMLLDKKIDHEAAIERIESVKKGHIYEAYL